MIFYNSSIGNCPLFYSNWTTGPGTVLQRFIWTLCLLYTSAQRKTPLPLICSAHLLPVGSSSVVILARIARKEAGYFWLCDTFWFRNAVAQQDYQRPYGTEMHSQSLSVWRKIDVGPNNPSAPTTVRGGA